MSTFYKAKFISTTIVCTKHHHGRLWALSSGKKGLFPERQINYSRTLNRLWVISCFQGALEKCGEPCEDRDLGNHSLCDTSVLLVHSFSIKSVQCATQNTYFRQCGSDRGPLGFGAG